MTMKPRMNRRNAADRLQVQAENLFQLSADARDARWFGMAESYRAEAIEMARRAYNLSPTASRLAMLINR